MSDPGQNATSRVTTRHAHGTDGALDRMLRLSARQRNVSAIFIHAGAGFHSHQNEHVHLEACVSAAEMGMKFLKAGATASEAVEAALRVLEDKEITNAGYGSNLSIDGTVECDATIVDHLGRSGACGAVPNIRNPISLAKLILDSSSRPLSLRRVPPNALVGEGARIFAEEHGLVTCPNEHLISRNSRDRFFRWQEDLMRAEGRTRDPYSNLTDQLIGPNCRPDQYDIPNGLGTGTTVPRDHTAAILAGTWNEGQPDAPCVTTPTLGSSKTQEHALSMSRGMMPPFQPIPELADTSANQALGMTTLFGMDARVSSAGREKQQDRSIEAGTSPGKSGPMHRQASDSLPAQRGSFRDGTSSPGRGEVTQVKPHNERAVPELSDPLRVKRPLQGTDENRQPGHREEKRRMQSKDREDDDMVTDTIGAIAIDELGRIAAGSSSGGIGMKHRGRLGPAALVGIGTAVVPCAEDDEDGVTVAAVTSGTGEHMATTMASQRCAERIYRGTRRGPAGVDVPGENEDVVLESFIAQDFMDHPGVRGCSSQGAIGVMVVKKCRTGYYLYFAHNTDSFALASMGGLEKEPQCTMSRLPNGAKITKGGRKIRIY